MAEIVDDEEITFRVEVGAGVGLPAQLKIIESRGGRFSRTLSRMRMERAVSRDTVAIFSMDDECETAATVAEAAHLVQRAGFALADEWHSYGPSRMLYATLIKSDQ